MLYTVTAALVPLAVTGVILLRVGEEAQQQGFAERQQLAVAALAEKINFLAVNDAIVLPTDDDVLRSAGASPEIRAFIVDTMGHAVWHMQLPPGTDLSDHPAVQAYRDHPGLGTLRFVNAQGVAWAAAYASVGRRDWAVIVEQPAPNAFATVMRVHRRTLFCMCSMAVATLICGLMLAVSLRRSLARLLAGARAFGEGQLTQEILVTSNDEIGALAGTMNAMAQALHRSLQDLQASSRTLEISMDERTRQLKSAQAQLLLQAQLAAIGQLGAGVAHEVNNPLAALLGHVQLLLHGRDVADPDYESLKQIEEAAIRCRAITLNLLHFSQRSAMGRYTVQMNALAHEVVTLLKPSFHAAAIILQASFTSEPTELSADAAQISVVLTNLLTNARDATPPGGKVVVQTNVTADGVYVSFKDTGCGIAQEHLGRIFEPFFTTKQVWSNVGLGLSVAYRIVTDHHGRIDVQSHEGQGSTFTMFLPRLQPHADALNAPRTHKPVTAALG